MTDLQATLRDRFGAAVSPPLLDLHGRPRRTHTPEAVQAVCEIADSVLATGDAEIQRLRSYVDRYRTGLVGMSRRATRFRIAWRNARQRAARYRTETQQLRARVAELEAAEAAAEQRADRLAADLKAELDVNRRLFTQRQEMAAERYAWQERGDRAEARARALEAALDRVRAVAPMLDALDTLIATSSRDWGQ
jgi:hypothetical protein